MQRNDGMTYLERENDNSTYRIASRKLQSPQRILLFYCAAERCNVHSTSMAGTGALPGGVRLNVRICRYPSLLQEMITFLGSTSLPNPGILYVPSLSLRVITAPRPLISAVTLASVMILPLLSLTKPK